MLLTAVTEFLFEYSRSNVHMSQDDDPDGKLAIYTRKARVMR